MVYHTGVPWYTMVHHGIPWLYHGIPCLHYGIAEELIQLKYTITLWSSSVSVPRLAVDDNAEKCVMTVTWEQVEMTCVF